MPPKHTQSNRNSLEQEGGIFLAIEAIQKKGKQKSQHITEFNTEENPPFDGYVFGEERLAERTKNNEKGIGTINLFSLRSGHPAPHGI